MSKSLPLRVTYDLCLKQRKLVAVYKEWFYSHFFHPFCLSGKSRWDFTGKTKEMRLLSNKGKKDFKNPWFFKCEQLDSYLFPVIMMGLQLRHGVVAISLLLPERLCQTGATQVICVLLTKTSSHWSANQAGAGGWQNTYFINFQVIYNPMTSACLMHGVMMLNQGLEVIEGISYLLMYLFDYLFCGYEERGCSGCNWKLCPPHACSFQPFL